MDIHLLQFSQLLYRHVVSQTVYHLKELVFAFLRMYKERLPIRYTSKYIGNELQQTDRSIGGTVSIAVVRTFLQPF